MHAYNEINNAMKNYKYDLIANMVEETYKLI